MKAKIANGNLVSVQVLRKRKLLGLFPQTLVVYRQITVNDDGTTHSENLKTQWVSDKDIYPDELED